MNEKEGKNIYYIRSVNYTGDGNMIYVRAYICYLFICMYIYEYIHIQINKTHTHTHTHTHIYIYIYIYMCVYVCIYAQIVSEIGGHILDSCSVHPTKNFIQKCALLRFFFSSL